MNKNLKNKDKETLGIDGILGTKEEFLGIDGILGFDDGTVIEPKGLPRLRRKRKKAMEDKIKINKSAKKRKKSK